MDKKMTLMGVGDKILLVLLVSLAVAEGISLLCAPQFQITGETGPLWRVAVILAAVGFTLNLIAAFGMLAAHKKGQLATKGLYALCRNPMYAFQLLLTVPGLLLLFNSWLALLAVVPTFLAFKVFVKEEERHLERRFGAQYAAYKEKVLLKFL